jgi:hypothetical protein
MSQLASDAQAIAKAVSAIWSQPSRCKTDSPKPTFEQLQTLIELAQS